MRFQILEIAPSYALAKILKIYIIAKIKFEKKEQQKFVTKIYTKSYSLRGSNNTKFTKALLNTIAIDFSDDI